MCLYHGGVLESNPHDKLGNYCILFIGEIIFLIQATAQKLQMQGVQLNSPSVLPQDVGVSEDDPHWIIYR